jgi:hypothetical protein
VQESCLKTKQHYEPPTLARLTGKQSRSHMLNHARELLELLFPGRAKQAVEEADEPKAYAAPHFTKLTPEQANLKLLGHFAFGDPGARDLLELICCYRDDVVCKCFCHVSRNCLSDDAFERRACGRV